MLGAVYIVYLSLNNIINAHKFNYQRIDSVNTKKINLFNAYKEGFTTMILNPKAILFYINILSQFINHQNNESVQGAILSGFFIVTVITWFSLCTFIFNYVKAIFQKPKFKMVFDYIISITLIALSVKILTTKQ
ncbi:LysE family translocator [Staphylococcus nepalensis]|uniref:LysE family translocator n=1 Tax=Staphylococcus nepalensis TaxID=214473 RepID=UPI001E394FAA|nr:LysE family transporter [Staphylococcus nepalensis]